MFSVARSNRREAFSEVASFLGSVTNLVSTPGKVGRKKGAFSGALGGSLGLLRC